MGDPRRGGVQSTRMGLGASWRVSSEMSCKVGAGAGQKGGWGEDGLRGTETGVRVVMSKTIHVRGMEGSGGSLKTCLGL